MLYSFDQFDSVLDAFGETIDTIEDIGSDLIDLVEPAYDSDQGEVVLAKLDIMLDNAAEMGSNFLDILDALEDTGSLDALNAGLADPVILKQMDTVISGYQQFADLVASLQADPLLASNTSLQDALASYSAILGGLNLANIVAGSKGDDVLEGEDEDDILSGFNGDDDIDGDLGDDLISGGDGNDHMEGEDGDDVLTGMDGNDVLLGGKGEDVLIAGEGRDKAQGGRHSDIFVCGEGSGKLVITDFENKVDFLALDFTARLGALDVEGSKKGVAISFNDDVLAIVKGVAAKAITTDDFVEVNL